MRKKSSDIEFSEFQVENAPLKGSSIIEASAGTGKTFNLTRIFLRLILENKLKVNEILVVTFTIAATSELRERIYELMHKSLEIISASKSGLIAEELKQNFFIDQQLSVILSNALKNRDQSMKLLSEAIRNYEESSVFTIHGFCNKILFEHAFETGMPYELELKSDDSDVRDAVIKNSWRKFSYGLNRDMLKFAMEHDYFYDEYHALAQQYLKSGAAGPLKIPISCDHYENSAAEFYRLNEQLRMQWKENSGEISVLLKGARLNGNKYRTDTVNKLFADMHVWSDSDANAAVLVPKFILLCESKIASALTAKSVKPDHSFFRNAQELYDLFLKLRMVLLSLYQQNLAGISEQHRLRNEKDGVLTYDDLIEKVHESIRNDELSDSLRKILSKKYPAALIDEFQDTDHKQWEIFYNLFLKTSSILFIIGDPRQSIYRFRGADIHSYMAARHSAGSLYTLSRNFRSTSEILGAVDGVYKRAENYSMNDLPGPFLSEELKFREIQPGKTFDKKLVFKEDSSALQFIIFEKEKMKMHHFEFTAGHISDLLSSSESGNANYISADGTSEKLKPSDIAVLVNTNRQAFRMQQELRKKNINSVVQIDQSVLDTDESEAFRSFLRALQTPENLNAMTLALSGELFGWDAGQIEYYIENDDVRNSIMMEFKNASRMRKSAGFMFVFQNLIHSEKITCEYYMRNESCESSGHVMTPAEKILLRKNGERVMMNFMHIAELLQKRQMNTVKDDMIWLKNEKRRFMQTLDGDEKILRLESDRDAVQILTVHKSKGLEFPVIYYPSLWSDALKEQKSGYASPVNGKTNLREFVSGKFLSILEDDINGVFSMEELKKSVQESLEEEERELIQEKMRLVYVALTRAVYRAVLIWGIPHQMKKNAAFYLLHGSDPFSGLEKKSEDKNGLKINKIISDLESLAQNENISVVRAEKSSSKIYTSQFNKKDLVRPGEESYVFSNTYKVSSYTGLIHKSAGYEDYDQSITDIHSYLFEKENYKTPAPETDSEKNIFTFEKGAAPGILIHKIFELISFQDTPGRIQEVCVRLLKSGGYDPEDWARIMAEHIYEVLHTPLSQNPSFALSAVSDELKISEMSFFMPVLRNQIEYDKIPDRSDFQLLKESFKSMHFQMEGGFLQGVADLIFKYEDKYYLLDWKSNHLGFTPENYSEERIRKAMIDEKYVIQYYMYLSALNRYLESSLPQYNYDNHFGGVVYLFIRGMQKDRNTGIFFDRPSAESIQWFTDAVRGASV